MCRRPQPHLPLPAWPSASRQLCCTHRAGAAACRAKTKGRGQRKEEDEDAELLQDEDDGGTHAGHRLQVQPSIITGGTLREYQMQGLNWMIHLYDNGINGILADEMVRRGFKRNGGGSRL